MYINFCCRSKETIKYLIIGRSTKRFAFFFKFISNHFVLTYAYVSSFFLSSENFYGKIGYSVRLELTRTFSLNDFQLVIALYGGFSLFFFECKMASEKIDPRLHKN